MISYPILKQLCKSNVKLLMLFTAVLCAFIIIMCTVFTPNNMQTIEQMANGSVLGNLLDGASSLNHFIANSFFVLMAIIFPMVYSIFVGNRMIAAMVDQGSMAYYVSSPLTRVKIANTSALYFIGSLIIMWCIVFCVGVAAGFYFQPDQLHVETFFYLNVGCFLYHFVISGICFLSSCIFNLSKNSLFFGAGIPIAFFVLNLLRKLSTDLDVLRFFTLNTLFDTDKILSGTGYMTNFIIMLILGLCLYVVGIIVFRRKDLPI